LRLTAAFFWPLFLLGAPIAHAQSDDPDIVVRGQKAVTAKQARKFVQTVTTEIDGQFARFDAPICPLVIGLTRRVATPIENRIRDVAFAAGASVAKGKCEANLFLVATDNADAWVTRFKKRYPAPFEDMWVDQRKQLKQSSRIHAWRVVELQNENGQPAGCLPLQPCILTVYSASHISKPVKQVTLNAVVVIEQEIIFQKTVPQIADYVAMRALAGAKPADATGPGTILSLFEPENAALPPELTEIDLGLLRGLYRTPQNGTAHRQANDISRSILRQARLANSESEPPKTK